MGPVPPEEGAGKPLDLQGGGDSFGVPAGGELEGNAYNPLANPGMKHCQAGYIGAPRRRADLAAGAPWATGRSLLRDQGAGCRPRAGDGARFRSRAAGSRSTARLHGPIAVPGLAYADMRPPPVLRRLLARFEHLVLRKERSRTASVVPQSTIMSR
jgi:hypothetical protein